MPEIEPVRSTQPVHVLIVEDNPADVRWVTEVFREAGLRHFLSVVGNGEDALQFLRCQGPYVAAGRPDLILLDLNVPRRNGLEVLMEISIDQRLRDIPLVVLTSSPVELPHLQSLFKLPASRYLLKPLDWPKYLESIRGFDHLYVSVLTQTASTQ